MSRSFLPSALLSALLGLAACGGGESAPEAGGHGHDLGHVSDDGPGHGGSRRNESAKGPHGGRLLESGDFALELTIFEDGVPPEFRLYPSLRGRPLPPAQVQASVELERIDGRPGGRRELHRLQPREDYLFSPAEIREPHSFTVKVNAQVAGRSHAWSYAAHEGLVEIEAGMAAASGVRTAVAGGGSLRESLRLYGAIQPDAERWRAVRARYPGLVERVFVQVGDRVKAGQTLATVESDESLQLYAVTAPIAGTVTRRAINPGESAGESALFEVSDLGSVWAELSVFARDRTRLKLGQTVEVTAADGAATGQGVIANLAPLAIANPTPGPMIQARVVLDNADGRWTPGQFVNARVSVGEAPAAVVVPLAALQRFRDWDVVFVTDGRRYQAQPVRLGRRDATLVEVTAGLEAGAQLVVANSYLLKADVEKSGAGHDH